MNFNDSHKVPFSILHLLSLIGTFWSAETVRTNQEKPCVNA